MPEQLLEDSKQPYVMQVWSHTSNFKLIPVTHDEQCLRRRKYLALEFFHQLD